jgi:hypothetical protein
MWMYKKAMALIVVVGLGFFLSGCITSDEIANIILGEATISGVVTDDATGSAIDGVTVTAIDPSGARTYPAVTSDAAGHYSITINRDTPVYFRFQENSTYVTMNSRLDSYAGDVSDMDMALYTTSRAQDVITQAFAFNPSLVSWGWLFVDVVLSNGDDSSGITITADDSGGALVDATATLCDGTNSGDTVTIACSGSNLRDGPMYIAYYNQDADITVTISGARSGQQQASVRMGQITYIKFQL